MTSSAVTSSTSCDLARPEGLTGKIPPADLKNLAGRSGRIEVLTDLRTWETLSAQLQNRQRFGVVTGFPERPLPFESSKLHPGRQTNKEACPTGTCLFCLPDPWMKGKTRQLIPWGESAACTQAHALTPVIAVGQQRRPYAPQPAQAYRFHCSHKARASAATHNSVQSWDRLAASSTWSCIRPASCRKLR